MELQKLNSPMTKLNIVAFCVRPLAYQCLVDWAKFYGHNLSLIVTSPGNLKRRNTTYREVISMCPSSQDIIVTIKPSNYVNHIRSIHPDIIILFTFPIKISKEIAEIPKFGSVNLHPAPLPKYRGPNTIRMVWNGEATIGATLHRVDDNFDTGPILSRCEYPIQSSLTLENLRRVYSNAAITVLNEGIPRAIANEPGMPQDHSQASYAALFSQEEFWINWDMPANVIQRRVCALNLHSDQAKGIIQNQAYIIHNAFALKDIGPIAPPGTVSAKFQDGFILHVENGLLLVNTTKILEESQ